VGAVGGREREREGELDRSGVKLPVVMAERGCRMSTFLSALLATATFQET